GSSGTAAAVRAHGGWGAIVMGAMEEIENTSHQAIESPTRHRSVIKIVAPGGKKLVS
ncbi:MAG: hypothetical protein HC884_10170, partial [Chloroflexaceae bacterium]|nr:hypothetical protein [Chloroflexaceae bacterium]